MDSGASLHMMSKSDLALEEQETIRKTKDPLVTLTANGTAHAADAGTEYVHDLDTFVEVQ